MYLDSNLHHVLELVSLFEPQEFFHVELAHFNFPRWSLIEMWDLSFSHWRLWRCDAIQTVRCLLIFWRYVLLQSSLLKTVASQPPKTLVNTVFISIQRLIRTLLLLYSDKSFEVSVSVIWSRLFFRIRDQLFNLVCTYTTCSHIAQTVRLLISRYVGYKSVRSKISVFHHQYTSNRCNK